MFVSNRYFRSKLRRVCQGTRIGGRQSESSRQKARQIVMYVLH